MSKRLAMMANTIGHAWWVVAALGLGWVATSPSARAQAAPAAGAQAAPDGADAGEGDGQDDDEPYSRRSNHFRNFTKVRSGSMIRKAQEQMADARPDLRGEYERRRDAEVIRHFQRLAELDAIAKIASDAGDAQLAGRVDEVRRAELERFRLAMDRLRRVIQARVRRGMP